MSEMMIWEALEFRKMWDLGS
jgi:hypothetical protein